MHPTSSTPIGSSPLFPGEAPGAPAPVTLALLSMFQVALLLCLFLPTRSASAQTTWFVDDDAAGSGDCTSWSDACPDLQTALDLANPGDQVWVATGTYTPAPSPGNRAATFQLKTGVSVYGGFAGDESSLSQRAGLFSQTKLSADLNADDGPAPFANNAENSYHVVTGSGTDPTAVLDGFTITGGNADGFFPHNVGGGMITESGSPTLANCTFSVNTALFGGGLLINAGDPTISNCTFTGNTVTFSGGALYTFNGANPILSDCTFDGNSAAFDGAGLFASGNGTLSLTTCTFHANGAGADGGALWNDANSQLTLPGCTFDQNTADAGAGGGVFNASSSTSVLVCVFNANTAASGAAFFNENCSPTITGCTFDANAAQNTGGAIHNDGSSPTLTACDFIGNSSDTKGGGIYNGNTSSPTLNNCTFSANASLTGGGGIHNALDSSPILANCDFIGNSTETDGGGISSIANSSPTLTNCTFLANSATVNGGGLCVRDTEGYAMTNCTFIGNSATGNGAGLFNDDAGLTMSNCLFDANAAGSGGGLYNTGTATVVTASTCTFSGNSATTFGGGIYDTGGGSLDVSNCTFNANSSDGRGGGMYVIGIGDRTIDATTFTGNSAGSDGGGIYSNNGSAPVITNCIFGSNQAGNNGGAMATAAGSDPELLNCQFDVNSATNQGGAIHNNTSNPIMTRCLFDGNSSIASDGGAIYNGASSPMMTDCRFIGNLAGSGSGGAVYNFANSNPMLMNCVFCGQNALTGGAIYNDNSDPIVTNSTFVSNNALTGDGGGMYNASGSNPTLTNCILREGSLAGPGNPVVTFSDIEGGFAGTGNIDEPPVFVDPLGPDLVPCTADDDLNLLVPASPCIDVGDSTALPADLPDLDGDGDMAERIPFDFENNPRLQGCRVDMGAFEANVPPPPSAPAGVLLVSTEGSADDGLTWLTAFTNLQGALAAAAASGGSITEIWVAAGTYKPAVVGNRLATFQLLSGVQIYGGFVCGDAARDDRDPVNNVTILSGDLADNDVPAEFPAGPSFTDNSYHVVTGSSTDATAVLDGFTIIGGNADGFLEQAHGGGMFNTSGSPTVINCTFSSNAAVDGGGMYNSSASNPAVVDCTFSGNTALAGNGGGICNVSSSNPAVTRCAFVQNSADNGGGMYNTGSSNPIITHSTFNVNSASANGGGINDVDSSNPMVNNCVFNGNTAVNGGGMYNADSSNPTVSHCTLSGNSAVSGGGFFNVSVSIPTVANCIVWDNAGGSSGGMESPIVSYSDVQGGIEGTNNIHADPLFVDPLGPDGLPGTGDEDLRLLPGSPCIDAGDNTSVPADAADLDGDGDVSERTPLDLDGNPRFADDPATPDTGVPDPPNYPDVVDMGAFEFQNSGLMGDINGDMVVDGADIQGFLECVMDSSGSGWDCSLADIDGAGGVTMNDVNLFVAMLTEP